MPTLKGGPEALNTELEKQYKAALDRGYNKETASKIAWTVVKKMGWKKVDEKWIKENNDFNGDYVTEMQSLALNILIEEDNGIKDIQNLINVTVGKIKSLTKKHHVTVFPDLEELRTTVNKSIVSMKKRNGENEKLSNGDVVKMMKLLKEDELRFRDDYHKLVKDVILSLRVKKEKNKWIDIRELITPFLKLKCK